MGMVYLHSRKPTANAHENQWLEDDPASFWGQKPIFRGELLVSGRVPTFAIKINQMYGILTYILPYKLTINVGKYTVRL